MTGLLAFGRLADDPQRILAVVQPLALVFLKKDANLPFRFGGTRDMGLECGAAGFTHPDCIRGLPFHDPKIPFCHALSLAHPARGLADCGNQTAPLPACAPPLDGWHVCGRLFFAADDSSAQSHRAEIEFCDLKSVRPRGVFRFNLHPQ